MPSPRKLIIPGLLIALVLGALLPTTGAIGRAYQAIARPPANIVKMLLAPGASAFNAVTTALRDTGDRAVATEKLLALHEQVWRDALLLRLYYDNERLRRENAALQELSTRFVGRDYTFRLVSVIGRRFEPAGHTFTLGHGGRHGLAEGQVVVAGPNLVGRVVDAGRSTATVNLISTPGTRLNTIVAPADWSRTGIRRAQLQTRQFDADGADRLVALVPDAAPIEVGHIAYLRDRGFEWPAEAQGMVVGQVVHIEPVYDPPQRKRVVVRPLRPFRFIDKITVLVTSADAQAQPDDREGGE